MNFSSYIVGCDSGDCNNSTGAEKACTGEAQCSSTHDAKNCEKKEFQYCTCKTPKLRSMGGGTPASPRWELCEECRLERKK